MAHAEKRGALWRGRFYRPDGTRGSTSGHRTKAAALAEAHDEESRIRNNQWIDRRDADVLFRDFADEWLAAVSPRLAPATAAKYRSYLDKHLIPQWGSWSLIGIFNGYLDIEDWVSTLHETCAESSVSSYYALFSTILNAAVRARALPANPCYGVRVSSGDYEPDRLVASPVQALRAAMRLYTAGLSQSGFMLGLMDFYTGARWGELAGQQPHEYDAAKRAIRISEPLKEVGGRLTKGGQDAGMAVGAPTFPARPARRVQRGARTKSPAGTRWVQLPPSIALLYEQLLATTTTAFVFTTSEGHPWHRGNFRQRYWRPAWDGIKPDQPTAADHLPAILPWFTFHEGRHTHATWLAEDGIAEVARRARLGQKMRGMARVYDHVTPAMETAISNALEARWAASLAALDHPERALLQSWYPHLGAAPARRRLTSPPKLTPVAPTGLLVRSLRRPSDLG